MPERSDYATDKSGVVSTVADSVLVIVMVLPRSHECYFEASLTDWHGYAANVGLC